MIRDRRAPSLTGGVERHLWNGAQPWTLDRLIRQQWSLTNRSGYTARSVTFTAHGALAVFGQRDWMLTIDLLEAGQGYAITATSTWGSTVDRPLIDVTWFDDRQPDRMQLATLRWPTSPVRYAGAPR